MKTYNFFIIFLLIFCINIINAQEVFFKDNTTILKRIDPSHYYPMQKGKMLDEFIRKEASDKLTMVSTDYDLAPDRFGNDGECLAMSQAIGYIKTPDAQYEEMMNNKVINMSFWVSYESAVYQGTKDGIVFSIRNKSNPSIIEMICRIEKKQLVFYAQRPNISGSRSLVPAFKMDFLVESGGALLNQYFFFCLTSENTTNGKRTKVYISKPDGSLYSRSFYIYPFEGINASQTQLVLWGGWPPSGTVRAQRMDDLMFFQHNEYQNRTLTSEEVLNNFYIQSPLYEGISYGISANMQESSGAPMYNGILGLENDNRQLYPEYVISKSETGTAFSPYHSTRFMVLKHPNNFQSYRIASAKMGGFVHPSTNWYAYMNNSNQDDNYQFFQYRRNIAYPENMYIPGRNPVIDGQFKLYNASSQRFLTTAIGSQPYPYLNYYNGGDPKYRNFSIRSAFKVDRGTDKSYAGLVSLRNHSRKPEGEVVSAQNSNVPSFMGMGWSDYGKKARMQIENPTVGFKMRQFLFEDGGGLGFYFQCKNISEGNALLRADNVNSCKFYLMYVEDDQNGKPLYVIRPDMSNGDRLIFNGFFLGGRAGGQPDIEQNYENVLGTNGIVPESVLWSIHKAD